MHTRLSILPSPPVCSPTDVTVRQRVERLQHKTKRYTDAKRGARAPCFQEGDKVRVRNHLHVSKGHRKFTDPLKVNKKLGVGTYVLSDGKTWNASKLTAFPCTTTTPAENAGHCTNTHTLRPKRNTHKPSWLNDYVP